jgi:hypothetical protein
MDLKQKMIDLAREATGDDEIFVAGDFQPKGMLWKRAAGTAAGSLAGGAVSDGDTWAQAAGAVGGYAAGTLASSGKGVPPVCVLAASPTKLYVLATSHGQGMLLVKHLEVLEVFNRNELTITVKNRIQTRTAIIENEETGARIELEGLKLGIHHMNDLLNVLDEQEAAEGEAETRVRLEAAEAADSA